MFITLEGIEGSGKTTQARHIADFLQTRKFDCILTREPGGTEIGKQIRAIVLDPASRHMDPTTELLLYMADRVQHINELIIPALSDGKVVICDRYADATAVYQGFARGLSTELIRQLHQMLISRLTPDVTLLLDLPAETGLARAWEQINTGIRTCHESRFEKETLSFHEKVRDGYLKLARLEPERFRIIDASADETHIRQEILNIISDLLKNRLP